MIVELLNALGNFVRTGDGTTLRASAATLAGNGDESANAALNYLRRRRLGWKAADVPRLLYLDQLAGVACKLTAEEHQLIADIQQRRPRGRPVSGAGPKTWDEQIVYLADWHRTPRDTPSRRRVSVRKSLFYEKGVLQAYEGEHARQRRLGAPSAYERAEEAVAEVYGVSPAKVRQICSRVRRREREWVARTPGAGLRDEVDETALEQRRAWLEQGPAPGELI